MNDIPGEFESWKKRISTELERELALREESFGAIHRLGTDASSRISRFAVGGKMVRGGLVCVGTLLARADVPETAFRAAVAVELLHSALLVHDDIMDRDALRRGTPSIHQQYAEMGRVDEVNEPDHIGESLAVCLGDVAFFVAFEILSNLDVPEHLRNHIVGLAARELQFVGVAQMADVYRGALRFDSNSDSTGSRSNDALRVYLYKTGRYTFSLPLMIGSLLAASDDGLLSSIQELGESIGILYQIKDDEIGLFGDSEETGKPTGSDIREGKKTIFITELLSRANDTDLSRFDSVFGNQEATGDDIAWVLELIERSGTRGAIENLGAELGVNASKSIDSIGSGGRNGKRLIAEMLTFNSSRVR